MTQLTFPNNFWWGAATSGPQSEGRFNKKKNNVFDEWFDKQPEDFYDQIGPDVTSNFYNSFKEDIQLMKKVGLNSLRTSIQWSRLIKNFETQEVEEDAVRFYNEVIDELIKQGITPVFNLHHFDLPVALLEKYGGWESKKVTDLFAGFAEVCFNLFGDRVKHWVTFNEPMVIVDGGYLYQFHYPHIVDGKKAVQVAYNIVLASAKAIEKYRLNQHGDGEIGIVLNLTPSYAASDSEADQYAKKVADLWNNQLFLDPSIKGEFPKELVDLLVKDSVCWETNEEELKLIQKYTIDFLGVNFYHPNRVRQPQISPDSLGIDWMPNRYFAHYEMPGQRLNIDKGWEIYPQAMYDISKNIQNNYGNIKWFVSENGIGISREERFLNDEGIIEDDYRIQFIQEHLYWLHKGISEGSNCFGYHLWTPIDCWSWKNAYRNRYGLVSTNIHTQIKTIKKSGYWYKTLSENNGFTIE